MGAGEPDAASARDRGRPSRRSAGEDHSQKLLAKTGLRARPKAWSRDDIHSMDSYLPLQVPAMARRVAEALELSELAAT
ncbi:hypothetical protein ACIQUY_38910 [Streptomyces sp. NPDC090231]|uniref:hypothetical protein n=1 Tax=unclassified Streptomyces TaxID=2593676 RepID=UPI003804F136